MEIPNKPDTDSAPKELDRREQSRLKRQALNLTQDDVARKAKVDRSKLSLYESGLVDLAPAELRRVEKVLNDPRQKQFTTEEFINARFDLLNPYMGFVADHILESQTKEEAHRRRFMRQRSGLNQRELARRAKIPRNKLMQWEACKEGVTLSTEEINRLVKEAYEAEALKSAGNPSWADVEQAFKAAESAQQECQWWRTQVDEQNKRIAEFTKLGYAILPVSTIQENEALKAKIAELEEEIRKLKEESNG